MKILVIFDSFFGNTKKIGEMIAEELSSDHELTLLKVDTASLSQLPLADLIFFGSPTRAFSASPNMTSFLKSIPPQTLDNVKVAVFDTRVAPEDIKPRLLGLAIKLAGYADKKMISLLKTSGANVILPGEGFTVAGSEGPLREGELVRASAWARSIVSKIAKNN